MGKKGMKGDEISLPVCLVTGEHAIYAVLAELQYVRKCTDGRTYFRRMYSENGRARRAERTRK